MSEDKQNIHCLHICGHYDKMMEEKSLKKQEEKKQSIKPPIQCHTSEDSGVLHEMYGGKVQRTEPTEEKKQMMRELMQAIEDAKLAQSLMLLHAKEEELGLRRHPSTLSHMHHDDSDSEGEVETFGSHLNLPDAAATGASAPVDDDDAPVGDADAPVDDANAHVDDAEALVDDADTHVDDADTNNNVCSAGSNSQEPEDCGGEANE